MHKKSIRDIDVCDKVVFCRVDFNVPMDDGNITDDTRIKSSLSTIRYLLESGAKIILASHLGRPKGVQVAKLRLDAVAEQLQKHLGKPIIKLDDSVGEPVTQQVELLKQGDVLLLENIRFNPGEEKNDENLAKKWADLADVFVDDAFGVAHRAHASNVGIANYLPSVAGFLLEREIYYLDKFMQKPKRPFTAIIGGAKVRDKIGVIQKLITMVDNILIGGGLAFTFLGALGYEIGKSIFERDKIDLANKLIRQARDTGVQLLLPLDIIVSDDINNDINIKCVDINNMPSNVVGLDIGSKTIEIFAKVIEESETIFWNGPMGLFEREAFSQGTMCVAKSIAGSSATSIVGGGDSIAALRQGGYLDQITHVSTGGGASLEFIEGKVLPGICALDDKSRDLTTKKVNLI